MEFHILGPLEVTKDAQPLSLGGPKQRAVLAVLLLHANEVVSVDRLVDEVWGDHPPEGATKTLQVYVSNLRKVLEPGRSGAAPAQVLVTRRPGYLLNVAPEELDSSRFASLVASGRQALASARPGESAELLGQALALWRGPALADLSDEPFALTYMPALEEARVAAWEDRIEADLALGRHSEVVGELEELVAAHPLRERLRGQLMVALYRSGRQAEALRAYQQAREVLVEELGIDPSPALRDLERAVLDQDPALDGPGRAPTAPSARRRRLPTYLTSFVGRERELVELAELLRREHLVTLTGVGGTGKTRLAVALASRMADDAIQDVWVVELAAVAEPALVAQAVASSMGLQDQAGGSLVDTIVRHVGDRAAVVVLDNCEHLLEPCAEICEVLLGACPGLRILATSREALRVGGERTWSLAPLGLPGLDADPSPAVVAESEAVALFVERARSARPGFALNDANAGAVTAICRRLDGIPFAIELAAARLRSLSLEQVQARLHDRFRLLTGGSRTALPRLQTLRATIDWGYDLLSVPEKVLLGRLAVFAGGWTLPAAEAVAAEDPIADSDIVDLLGQLVDKSLVVVDERGGELRYRLLETIRDYAREKLMAAGEADRFRSRHCGFFLALAEEAEAQLRGPQQQRWLDRLDTEHDNLRAALRFAAENEPESAVRLAGALVRFWDERGHGREATEWLERVLALPAGTPAARAKALRGAGLFLSFFAGRIEEGLALAEHALELAREAGDPGQTLEALITAGLLRAWRDDYAGSTELLDEALSMARELHHLGAMAEIHIYRSDNARVQGQLALALQLCEESVAVARAAHFPGGILSGLIYLAVTCKHVGEARRAKGLLEEALVLGRELNDVYAIARGLMELAEVLAELGHEADADRMITEALVHSRQFGEPWLVARALLAQGRVTSEAGDLSRSEALYMESLVRASDLLERVLVARSLEGMACIAAKRHEPARAAQLLGAAEGVREQVEAPLTPAEVALRDELLEAVRKSLCEAELTEAWGSGKTMSQEPTLDLASAMTGEQIGEASSALGN